jgi:hypothetical protein
MEHDLHEQYEEQKRSVQNLKKERAGIDVKSDHFWDNRDLHMRRYRI